MLDAQESILLLILAILRQASCLDLLERGLRPIYKEESSRLYTGLEEDLQPQLKNLPIQTESFQTDFQFLFQCIITPDLASSGTSIARGTSTSDVGWDPGVRSLVASVCKGLYAMRGHIE